MSTQPNKLPLSAVIFDRTQKGLSDVPTFSAALKNKVNDASVLPKSEEVSPAAHAILAKLKQQEQAAKTSAVLTTPSMPQAMIEVTSAVEKTPDAIPLDTEETQPTQQVVLPVQKKENSDSRADSVRGQTTGFAQGPEFKLVVGTKPSARLETRAREVKKEQLPKTDSVSSLFEEPTLLRWAAQDTDTLHRHLQTLTRNLHVSSNVIGSPQFARVSVSTAAVALSSTHTHGLIDRVVIPKYPTSVLDPIEEYIIGFKRILWNIRFETLKDKTLQIGIKAKILSLVDSLLEIVETISKRVITKIKTQGIRSLQYVHDLPTRFHRVASSLQTTTSGITKKREEAEAHVVEKVSQFFPRLASRLMIAASLVLMLMTVGPMVALEANSWKQRLLWSLTPKAGEMSEQPIQASASPTPSPSPTPNPDPDKQFQILIPKIGVNSKIVANVDPGNEQEYTEALKKGVAHAKGTGLPGEKNEENKTIFIFGHSTNGTWNITRYNALFYAVKDLVVGDEFSVWFWGKEFQYTVKERRVVEATDVSFLQPQTEKDQIILQTCWPPGTSWKRLIVVAEPKQ